jgi:hypothetical protein
MRGVNDMEYDCSFTQENKWFRYRAAAIIIELILCFLGIN